MYNIKGFVACEESSVVSEPNAINSSKKSFDVTRWLCDRCVLWSKKDVKKVSEMFGE